MLRHSVKTVYATFLDCSPDKACFGVKKIHKYAHNFFAIILLHHRDGHFNDHLDKEPWTRFVEYVMKPANLPFSCLVACFVHTSDKTVSQHELVFCLAPISPANSVYLD